MQSIRRIKALSKEMEQTRELMVEMETLPMLVTEVEEAIHRMQNTKISTYVSSVRVLQIRVRYNLIQTFRKLNSTKPHQREGKRIHCMRLAD